MNALTIQTRLPLPAEAGVSVQQWRVLTETIWPAAKSAEAVAMALDYCRVRKLDPFKRPVHIVPMWNSQLRREVETVWPGISEIQTTAARTGQWAGMDAPQWGPDITQTFSGSVGKQGQERKVEVTLTFPEWCSITVYRLIGGQRCAFCEPVYWLEAYARIGRSTVPNDMWQKRVRGQLHKVAKAASLRAAFPEETGNDYTAEEMEGREIEGGGVVIEGSAEQVSMAEPPATKVADTRADDAFLAILKERIAKCADAADVLRVGDGWRRTVENAAAAGKPLPATLIEAAKDLIADAYARFQPTLSPDDEDESEWPGAADEPETADEAA